MTMKVLTWIFIAAALCAAPACKKKAPMDSMQNGINDALDRRPGEKVLDATEDAKDAVKDAAGDIKEAVHDATK